jgi:hypothetical protein
MAAVKTETNVAVSYNSNRIDAYLNSTSLEAVAGIIDVTNFDSTGKEHINDTPEWSCSVGGLWDATLHDYFQSDVITPGTKKTVIIWFTDASDNHRSFTWTSNGEIADYTISASTGGFIEWSGTLRLSGAPSTGTGDPDA